MKFFLIILLFLSFIQTTIIPFDLVLVILLLHTYIRPGKQNLYLAFFFGILISHLTQQPLGLYPIVYLFLVELAQSLTTAPIHKNLFFAGFALLSFLTFEKLVLGKFAGTSLYLWPVLTEIIIALPVYFILKIWNERFIIKKDIRLRI